MKLRPPLKRRLETLERRLQSFKPTRVRHLTDATELAYLAFVFEDDARMAAALGCLHPIPFDGDFNKWSPIEGAKSLRAWVRRDEPDEDEPARTRRELLAAGVHPARLRGRLLKGPHGRHADIRRAEAGGSPRDLFDWRRLLLQELIFLWCAGARPGLLRPPFEKQVLSCLAALRESIEESGSRP